MFSCYDPQLYYAPPIKSEKLSDEAVGPMDMVSLAKGQFRYTYCDDGLGRRRKKKIILADWSLHTHSPFTTYCIKKLLNEGFDVLIAYADKFKKITKRDLFSVPPPAVMKPSEIYKLAAEAGISRDEIFLIDPLTFSHKEWYLFTCALKGFINLLVLRKANLPLEKAIESLTEFKGVFSDNITELRPFLARSTCNIATSIETALKLSDAELVRVEALYPSGPVEELPVLLKKIPHLKTLSIKGFLGITGELIEYNLASLEHLFLTGTELSSAHFQTLLTRCPLLKTLALHSIWIEDAGALMISRLPNLEQLALEGYLGLAMIEKLLYNAPSLKELVFGGNPEGDFTLDFHLPLLEKLTLKDSPSEPVSANKFERLIAASPRLKVLILDDWAINDALEAPMYLPELEEFCMSLDLEYDNDRDESEYIENIIANARKIKKIALSGVAITREFSKNFHFEELEFLSLRFFSYDGMLKGENLEKLFNHTPRLRTLELIGLHSEYYYSEIVGSKGKVFNFPELEYCSLQLELLFVDDIEKFLINAPKLQILRLSCGRIEGDFRSDLCLPALETLEFNHGFTQDGNNDWVRQLSKLASKAPKLKNLVLIDGLTRIFVEEFDFSSVECIELKSCDIPAALLEKLITRAPKLNKLILRDISVYGEFSPSLNLLSLEEVFIDNTTIMKNNFERLAAVPKFNAHMAHQTIELIAESSNVLATPHTIEGDALGAASFPTPLLKKNTQKSCSTEQKKGKLQYSDHLYQRNSEGKLTPYPEPCFYRTNIYQTFVADTASPDIIFSNIYKSASLKNIYCMDFLSQEQANIWGSYLLSLTSEWQSFPTLNATDNLCSLEARLGDSVISVEIARCTSTGQYLVRLPEGALASSESVRLSYSLQHFTSLPLPVKTPSWITELVDTYRHFKEEDIDFTGVSTGAEMLGAIKDQKAGACRYRALSFMHEFNKYLSEHHDTPCKVQFVINDIHAFVEIIHDGIHYTVDLGGIGAELEKRENPVPSGFSDLDTALSCDEDLDVSPPPIVTFHAFDCISIASKSPCYLQANEARTISSAMIVWQKAHQKEIAENSLHFFSEAFQLNEFLKRPYVPPQTLIIDIQHWTARERVKLHAILDQPDLKRPNILLLDTPHTLSEDFTSRLRQIHSLNSSTEAIYNQAAYSLIGNLGSVTAFPSQTNLGTPTIVYGEDNEAASSIIIDFYNNPSDWPRKLFGELSLSTTETSWDTSSSCLINGINSLPADSSVKIILKNPPQDSRFWSWWQTAVIKREVAYDGLVSIPLPNMLTIEIQHGYNLDRDAWPIAEILSEPVAELLLNDSTYSSYFSVMEQAREGLCMKPGWLERYKDQTIKITLTGELSLHQWMELVETASTYNIKFNIEHYAGIYFPEVIEQAIKIKIPGFKPNITPPFNEAPSEDIISTAIHIPLQALTILDLTGQWKKEDGDKLHYAISQLTTYVTEDGGDKKPLIFHGAFSKLSAAFKQQLMMAVRHKKWFVNGELRNIHAPIYFVETPTTVLKKYELPIFNYLTSPRLTGLQIERLEAVKNVLNDYPWIVIEGSTGVGKTHFFFSTLLPYLKIESTAHGAIGFSGMEQLTEWALCNTPGPKLLLLDEANIDTPLDWLAGLAELPPILYWKGNIYPLSADHRVVLLRNPINYSGERINHPFLEIPEIKVTFMPSSLDDLYEDTLIPLFKLLGIPEDNWRELRDIYFDIYASLFNTELTPRELQMMAFLTQQSREKIGSGDLKYHAMYAALTIAKQVLNPKDEAAFDELAVTYEFDAIKPVLGCAPVTSSSSSDDFIILPEHNEVSYALDSMLDLHIKRKALSTTIEGGLGLCSLGIEGAPGMGKTAFVKANLRIKGFKELPLENLFSNHYDPDDHYFVSVPTSAMLEEKETILRSAFQAGHVVLIDEINCGARLERVMNELLDSMHTGITSSKRYGLIIGTQNPIDFAGRSQASLATKHRQWTVQFPNSYSQESLFQFLLKKYPSISFDLAHQLSSNFFKTGVSIRAAKPQIEAAIEAETRATLALLGSLAPPTGPSTPPAEEVGVKRRRPYDDMPQDDNYSSELGMEGMDGIDEDDDDSAFDAVYPQQAKRPRTHYYPTLFSSRLPIIEEDDDVDISLTG